MNSSWAAAKGPLMAAPGARRTLLRMASGARPAS